MLTGIGANVAAQELGGAAPTGEVRPPLVDLDGNTWHWPAAGSADKPLVLVFIATDCPIANGYLPLLQRMSDERGNDGVSFLLVHPRKGVTEAEAAAHRTEFGIRIPVVLDRDQKIARAARASVTPQAAIFDGSSTQPVYSGRIDDLYAGFGRKRPAATTHDLADALDQLLAGKPLSDSETEAVGCLIEWIDEGRPEPGPYDPLAESGVAVETLDLTVDDDEREREIPLRVYLAKKEGPSSPAGGEDQPGERPAAVDAAAPATCPVVLFSHGLGGSREGSAFLGRHWASHGYVAVFLQHPGSDDSVWRGTPLRERMSAMKSAASGRNLLLRVGDVQAALDQLEKWNGQPVHALAGRLDLSQVGMSGHSFGAVTTQAVSGQSVMGRQDGLDPRIDAALAMSPSPPAIGTAARAFGEVPVPWMLMTGTLDTSIISSTTVEDRLKVFPALPAGGKYELVLDGAEHSAFTERALPGDQRGRNPNHHRAILALSTAFWDAFLRQDPSAREWLDGNGPQQILEPADRWQKK